MLIIRNGYVMDPATGLSGERDIVINNGVVEKICTGKELEAFDISGAEVIDATGCIVAPGLVDAHTHIGGIVRRGNTVFVNPGSPSLSKRPDGRQTIALLDGATLSLRDLYSGEVLETMALA